MPRQSTLKIPAADDGLSPLERQALKIASKNADKTRDTLKKKNGQPVDFCVRIQGEMDVSGKSTSTVKQKPELDQMLCLVLTVMDPAERERVLSSLNKLGRRKKRSPPKFADLVVKHVENLITAFTTEAPQEKRGAVTGRLVVTRLGDDRPTTSRKAA